MEYDRRGVDPYHVGYLITICVESVPTRRSILRYNIIYREPPVFGAPISEGVGTSENGTFQAPVDEFDTDANRFHAMSDPHGPIPAARQILGALGEFTYQISYFGPGAMCMNYRGELKGAA